MEALDVYAYDDYRDFLREWFWLNKQRDDALSFRAISKKLGLKAPNHFHLVISRKRHLSPATCTKVKSLLSLDEASDQFFDLLFQYGIASTSQDQKRFERLIIGLRKLQSSQSQSNYQPSITTIAWYIKTCAYLFADKNPSDIIDYLTNGCMFSVEQDKVEQALALLQHQGVLNIENDICHFSPDLISLTANR